MFTASRLTYSEFVCTSPANDGRQGSVILQCSSTAIFSVIFPDPSVSGYWNLIGPLIFLSIILEIAITELHWLEFHSLHFLTSCAMALLARFTLCAYSSKDISVLCMLFWRYLKASLYKYGKYLVREIIAISVINLQLQTDWHRCRSRAILSELLNRPLKVPYWYDV